MPITYEIDPARRLILTRCVGHTDLREVMTHFEQLVNDPNCPPVLDVLLDLSEMTAVPDSGQLHAAAAATAKGGSIFAIKQKLGLPVKFVGVGEHMDDIEVFDPDAFVNALFETE